MSCPMTWLSGDAVSGLHVQGNEARFFVSAELHGAADREQPPPAIKRQSRTGTLQHQASSLSNAADDSEDTWQPDVADADDGSSQVH